MARKKEDNKVKLEDISTISSGLVLNRITSSDIESIAIDSDNIGEDIKKYYYISQKAVDDNHIDEEKFIPIYTKKNIEEKYKAHYKDIIMKITPPYSAAVIGFKRKDVIVPSNFAIIRIKKDFVAVFLCYLLNGPNVRKQLRRLVEGSNIAIVKISNLKNVKVKKRNKAKQVEFSKLFFLVDYRRWLLDRKQEIENILKEDLLAKLDK